MGHIQPTTTALKAVEVSAEDACGESLLYSLATERVKVDVSSGLGDEKLLGTTPKEVTGVQLAASVPSAEVRSRLFIILYVNVTLLTVLGPDVIPRGRLVSKHQLTNCLQSACRPAVEGSVWRGVLRRLLRKLSGLKETFIKRYIVERTTKAEIRPEEQSEKAESCRENLWKEYS